MQSNSSTSTSTAPPTAAASSVATTSSVTVSTSGPISNVVSGDSSGPQNQGGASQIKETSNITNLEQPKAQRDLKGRNPRNSNKRSEGKPKEALVNGTSV